MFIRHVNLNDWHCPNALGPSAVAQIRRLQLEVDEHFKPANHLTEMDGDLLINLRFVLVRGRTPHANAPHGRRH